MHNLFQRWFVALYMTCGIIKLVVMPISIVVIPQIRFPLFTNAKLLLPVNPLRYDSMNTSGVKNILISSMEDRRSLILNSTSGNFFSTKSHSWSLKHQLRSRPFLNLSNNPQSKPFLSHKVLPQHGIFFQWI